MARYDAVRLAIQNGDLIAFKGTHWISRAIRLRTLSGFSHVGVAMWVSFAGAPDRLFLVESTIDSGIRMGALSTEAPFYWISKPPQARWSEEAERFVANRVGRTKYDRFSILLAALGRDMRKDGRYTCNEFAAAIASRMNMVLKHPENQSPAGMVDGFIRLGGKVEALVE